jgi:FkbH-like protein
MPELQASADRFLVNLLGGFVDRPATLPAIFQLGDRISEAERSPIPDGAATQRIAVLGASTIDYLRRAVACAVLQEGVFPLLYQAPFGACAQEILDPGSALHAFGPELVVIASHWRDMIADGPMGCTAAEVDAALEPRIAMLRTLWDTLAARGARIIQHLIAPPPQRFRGVAERLLPASPANQVRRLNEMLLQAGAGRVTFLDMDALAQEIGIRRFAPAKFYYAAKLDHDLKWLPDYLPLFRAAWRCANARARKVLVLDLDNTLWGGVIGDDGVDGIELGPASPAGEAFQDWQRYLQALSRRGVILAVCSKNDPAVAETGFSHPDSVLRRQDFAAFDCSRDDKAAGLRRIARALNVGTDSLVFCDDNPAECELIRQELPEVAVVCAGADPSAFIDLFEAGHWLDLDTYTPEDLGRAAAYQARAAALSGQHAATDIAGFLASLEMTASLGTPREGEIARMAQLEMKTNQFNLTTRRYAEVQIRELLARDDAVVLAFRLRDRLGDHGLTATLVALHEADALRIDSWLMSCRIFSRSAEQFILRELVSIAASMGVAWLTGEYRPSGRNEVVAELYPRLGFAPAGQGLFRREVARGCDGLTTYIAAMAERRDAG